MDFYSSAKKQISDTEEYASFSKEFDYYIDFFQNFSELTFLNGRIISFITDKKAHILDTSLIDNAIQTLRSIKLCCSIGSIADANTLTRKLRDDLLLYIYMLDIIGRRKTFIEDDLTYLNVQDAEQFVSSFMDIRLNCILSEDEQAVEAWLSNTVTKPPYPGKKKLGFENYMKVLKQNENISKILIDYDLQKYWEKLQRRLNNYVHNNGKQFAMQNLISADNNEYIETYLKSINTHVSYIASFFLVLLLMIDATLISSTDMIDHLDAGIEPPENCQYSIANFVQEFIDTKITKLHPELKQYLKDNNNYGMRIE